MKPIFLVGFMGCGKTTLGRAVAAASTLTFIDLDELIESRQGRPVSEIFAAEGESGFRRIESDALRSVATVSDAIIATGGGTPLSPGNMELMNRSGITVFLDTSESRLVSRLAVAASNRPLIAALQPAELRGYVSDTLAARREAYLEARVTFSGDLLDTAGEIAITVDRFLESFNIPRINNV